MSNICWALSHANCSLHQLLCQFLCSNRTHSSALPYHSCSCIVALTKAAAIPLWSSARILMFPSNSTLSHTRLIMQPLNSSSPLLWTDVPEPSSFAHAGDWLNVIPFPSLSLHIMDCEFRVCLKCWLGLHIFEEGTKCTVCHSTADIFSDQSH